MRKFTENTEHNIWPLEDCLPKSRAYVRCNHLISKNTERQIPTLPVNARSPPTVPGLLELGTHTLPRNPALTQKPHHWVKFTAGGVWEKHLVNERHQARVSRVMTHDLLQHTNSVPSRLTERSGPRRKGRPAHPGLMVRTPIPMPSPASHQSLMIATLVFFFLSSRNEYLQMNVVNLLPQQVSSL